MSEPWPQRSLQALLFITLLGCGGRVSAPPGGGDGDGSGDGTTASFGGGGVHPSLGLISAAPAVDSVLVDWRAQELEEAPLGAALFIGTNAATIFDEPPITVAVAAGRHLITGLTQGTVYHVGMGVEGEPDQYSPVGPVLRVRPETVYYANASTLLPPGDQDGLTPETAFADPFLAIITALFGGGGNVWIAKGDYPDVSLPMKDGVDLYGGFPPEFNLAERDVSTHETSFIGLANEDVLRFDQGSVPIIVDGLTIEGLGEAENGALIDSRPAELRRVTVTEAGRGVKMRSSEDAQPATVKVIGCEFSRNRVEGLSLQGVFHLFVFACDFFENKNEGLDTGPAVAPGFENIELTILDSRFRGNGAEGMDLTLTAPVAPTGLSGSFDILIEDCDFVGNVLAGMLIDIDFEIEPTWHAEIVVRGCYFGANLDDGLQIDLDSHSSTLIHRCHLSTNRGDGLQITSESHRGLVTASSCAMLGNLGMGARANEGNLGNFALLLSHCVVAGNSAGGVEHGTLQGTATSSVAHIQAQPWLGVQPHFSLTLETPSAPFLSAPIRYLEVVSSSGSQLNTSTAPELAIGTLCELADDGGERTAVSVGVNNVILEPGPEVLPLPNRLTAFASGGSVREDYRPTPTSELIGAGMSFPGFPAEDCGPFGSPLGGAPGAEDLAAPRLFFLAETRPAHGAGLGSGEELALLFEGGLAAPALGPRAMRVTQGEGGAEVPVDSSVVDGELRITAPPGGWKPGMILELHRGLLSANGDPLAAPVALPLL